MFFNRNLASQIRQTFDSVIKNGRLSAIVHVEAGLDDIVRYHSFRVQGRICTSLFYRSIRKRIYRNR